MKSQYEEKIINRIKECETVLHELEHSELWSIIQRDAKTQQQNIDENWHLVEDEKKLIEFRIIKFAVKHLLDLSKKYSQDLEEAKTELIKIQNGDMIIQKDVDNESPLIEEEV